MNYLFIFVTKMLSFYSIAFEFYTQKSRIRGIMNNDTPKIPFTIAILPITLMVGAMI